MHRTTARLTLLLTLLVLLAGSCRGAHDAGSYDLASVPDVTVVGGEAYMDWFADHAVTDATLAFIAGHQAAAQAVLATVHKLTADTGARVQARKNREQPGKVGLKQPHKVEEKIYRMIRESEAQWARHDARERNKGGFFPRHVMPAEARRIVFSARPEAPVALRDIAGVRIVVPDLQTVWQLDERLRRHFGPAVIRYKDYIRTGYRGNGYRSVHFVVVHKGKPVEIQLRTLRQHQWAQWEHDLIYKGRFKADAEAREYARKVGERLHLQDQGRCPVPCALPACPPRLEAASGCFPEATPQPAGP